jgi:hypothetical protein
MLWEDLLTSYTHRILKQVTNFIEPLGFRSESNSWVWKNRRLNWKLLCIVGTLVNMHVHHWLRGQTKMGYGLEP